jgi:hypothetical protein
MHGLMIALGMFACTVWDISQNHGAWSRSTVSLAGGILRAVGFL